jgi:4-diphosphocytidyl-2-C-methyl-D-erythritol kinase
MTGVGDNLLLLQLPPLPCVMVNPRVPVATSDVFKALGLRNGELRVGFTDVLKAPKWPEEDASVDDWIKALNAVGNDLEAPALKVEPVIGEVLAALRGVEGVGLARMSGSGATCFALFGNDQDAQRAAQAIQVAHPLWWVHAGALS